MLSLALSPGLARVLGDRLSVPDTSVPLVQLSTRGAAGALAGRGNAAPSAPAATPGRGGKAAKPEAWQAAGHGSALLRGAVSMLASGRCSEAVRAAVLDVLDSLLGCGEPVVGWVLTPLLDDILVALKTVVVALWQQNAGSGRVSAAVPACRVVRCCCLYWRTCRAL